MRARGSGCDCYFFSDGRWRNAGGVTKGKRYGKSWYRTEDACGRRNTAMATASQCRCSVFYDGNCLPDVRWSRADDAMACAGEWRENGDAGKKAQSDCLHRQTLREFLAGPSVCGSHDKRLKTKKLNNK
jgi:hypothetical protein